MDRLIAMIEAGKLDVTPLITHRINLSEIEKGYDIFGSRKEPVVKIAIQP